MGVALMAQESRTMVGKELRHFDLNAPRRDS
jgi:hypothetical protein